MFTIKGWSSSNRMAFSDSTWSTCARRGFSQGVLRCQEPAGFSICALAPAPCPALPASSASSAPRRCHSPAAHAWARAYGFSVSAGRTKQCSLCVSQSTPYRKSPCRTFCRSQSHPAKARGVVSSPFAPPPRHQCLKPWCGGRCARQVEASPVTRPEISPLGQRGSSLHLEASTQSAWPRRTTLQCTWAWHAEAVAEVFCAAPGVCFLVADEKCACVQPSIPCKLHDNTPRITPHPTPVGR